MVFIKFIPNWMDDSVIFHRIEMDGWMDGWVWGISFTH
jgi:hypothetical protein